MPNRVPVATMEIARMAFEEQRARRVGEGFLRLADDRRRTPPAPPAAEELGETARTLLEGSPEGVAVVDASGSVVFWNSAAERLFGLERSRAVGQELASLIFPDHLQAAVRAVLLREVDEPGEGLAQRQIELGARRADGREIPVDIATTSIEVGSGRLLATFLRDASERSERERELHSDARRRSAVLDLGQVALEGMALDELLQRAVALSIDELGVDRCEVWQRDEGGDSLTLRANVGWPPVQAATRVPLATATQPGYTLLRGQGAIVVEDFRREGRFSSIGPDGSGAAQSSISIRIPGTNGGFGTLIASSESLRRFELSDISLFVSLAQTLGAAIERSRAIDSLADRRAPDSRADRASALDHLPRRPRDRRANGTSSRPRSRRSRATRSRSGWPTESSGTGSCTRRICRGSWRPRTPAPGRTARSTSPIGFASGTAR